MTGIELPDCYEVLMDIRSWIFDHMDQNGNVNVDMLDEYIANITDKMDYIDERKI